jgi:hypothetical protein
MKADRTWKIKNLKAPKCQRGDNASHAHYQASEVCLSSECLNAFVPLCLHCKFEEHKGHDVQPLKIALL